MSSNTRAIEREVQFGFLPAKKTEREFRFWDFLFIQIGFGIAAWCFLVGGYTGLVLNAQDSIVAILFGNAFPVFLIMPIAIYFARYGVETFIGFRSALGYLGSDAFFILFSILNLGWISISCFMIGESAIKIIGLVNGNEFWTSRNGGAPVFSLIAFAFSLFIAFKGPNAIKWFTRIGVPSIMLILIGLIIIIFIKEGFDKVFQLQPKQPYDTFARTMATAIEWNVGLGFSWLPYLGASSRLTVSEKVAYSGGFWGFGVLLNVAAIMGALTALLVGSTDPTDWMISFGGTGWGVLGLLLLILANTTSAVVLMYSQALSFKTLFPSKKWGWAIATTIPAGFLMLSPDFYDAYSKFLAFISFIMAVYSGIVIADYFFVKKQKINVRDLYRRGGVYQYWKGFNPASLVSFIVATVFYWTVYNPIKDEASTLFTYISAGIPTFFVALFVHYLAAKYIFKLDQDVESAQQSGVTQHG
ncbi:purine-cytosine permease family protein [Effusibacillus lacus]|uniref:Uncharacterized protein n=1 Tax=Effusibacillus lacus TaxID=1348429 RepID=A0A292YEK5_9BACL|nr:cytosine permease [Effusibacillus lacus]TCS75909.1 NCS1 family nucleobase:cation symporter-1 [Effusibacillus lacus]GAX91702.1 hypothetical protein EFBL_3392 [Effusibacillus lacus]